jgi:HSP20 family molecular chaperone IbpA
VPLPFEAKAEEVQAIMNDGLLEVRIPKPTEAKSPGTQIPVN